MRFSRRQITQALVTTSLVGAATAPTWAMPAGTWPAKSTDVDTANQIASTLPTHTYLDVMSSLSKLNTVGTTGELFRARWKNYANPLIVRMFHDIGYATTPLAGDCTSWCAAAVAWCLKRDGKPIPSQPASSQSFLDYGTAVGDPKIGDLCVFTDIADRAHGHVALFYGHAGGSRVKLLGGNQSSLGSTNCGAGYQRSSIDMIVLDTNPRKDRNVGFLYLNKFVRPPV